MTLMKALLIQSQNEMISSHFRCCANLIDCNFMIVSDLLCKSSLNCLIKDGFDSSFLEKLKRKVYFFFF